MTTYKQLLEDATHRLKAVSDTPRLDAEILLAHVLQKPRSVFFTWPDREVANEDEKIFSDLLRRREVGEPVAYLIGHKEFWSLDYLVTKDTLIPRPETELLVELALECLPANQACRVADLGTGSGAIAIALAHERPHWQLVATDQSEPALTIAKLNAKQNRVHNIEFVLGDWCEALPRKDFHAIVSNPPYIAEDDPHLEYSARHYDPKTALIASKDGMAAIEKIIAQAQSHLTAKGFLLLEHGFLQAEVVQQTFLRCGYERISSHCDLAGHIRATMAYVP